MRLFFTHTPLGQRSLGSLTGGIPQPPIASRSAATKKARSQVMVSRQDDRVNGQLLRRFLHLLFTSLHHVYQFDL